MTPEDQDRLASEQDQYPKSMTRPPLPEPDCFDIFQTLYCHSAKHMHAYADAREAVLQERIKLLEGALRKLIGEIDGAPGFARSHIQLWFPEALRVARAALEQKS